MGAEDIARQALNVFRMRLLGAEVRSVDAGSRTLKDAINEAMRDWVARPEDTHYLLGSALGPASLSADGARVPVRDRTRGAGADASSWPVALPDAVIACVGGGSNAIGIFDAFVEDEDVQLDGRSKRAAEASCRDGTPRASPADRPACCRARARSCCRTKPATSSSRTRCRRASTTRRWDRSTRGCTSAGAREYHYVSDEEALAAFQALARLEGILPALESSHAIAHVLKAGRSFGPRRGAAGESLGPRRQGRPDRRAEAAGGGTCRALKAAFAT